MLNSKPYFTTNQLLPLVDFGLQPISNRYLHVTDQQQVPCFPCSLGLEPDIGLIRMTKPFPAEELRPRWPGLNNFEPEDHLDELASRLCKLPGIHRNSKVVGATFKDESTLARLEKRGFKKIRRLDMRHDLEIQEPWAAVESFVDAFRVKQAKKIAGKEGKADILIVRHVMEHATDAAEFLDACKALVNPGGFVVLEVPDCTRALELCDYTVVWEEHNYYFTAQTFRQTLQKYGHPIFDFQIASYPMENSLIAILQIGRKNSLIKQLDTVQVESEILRAEKFATSLASRQTAVRKNLQRLKATKSRMAMFGAGHLSVAFLSILGVHDLVNVVMDDNTQKQRLRIPVANLPIQGSECLSDLGIGVCLLALNPLNHPKILLKHDYFLQRGGIFASIFPETPLALESIG